MIIYRLRYFRGRLTNLQNLKFSFLKGPQRSSDQIFTYFNASAVSRSTKPEIFMSLPLSVLSQSGPPKSVGGGS